METNSIAIDLDAAAEFMLRRRGRVRVRYIVVPLIGLWAAAAAIAFVDGRAGRPDYLPFTMALYGCVAFFVHAYFVGWRSGVLFWRYMSLLAATVFYVALAALHADDAGVWADVLGAAGRPPRPRLVSAAACNVVSVALLGIHGFVLGTGSHAPVQKPVPASTSAVESAPPDRAAAAVASTGPDSPPPPPDAEATNGDQA